MAGFLALRNTWRPLSSRSIAEFWNRYYYYFKELLVDCFFYPAFMRYFKTWGRWRLFAATVAAAGFGNALFHSLRDLNYVEDLGFWRALAGFQSYIFYTAVLSVGIGISQMRQQNIEKKTENLGRIAPGHSSPVRQRFLLYSESFRLHLQEISNFRELPVLGASSEFGFVRSDMERKEQFVNSFKLCWLEKGMSNLSPTTHHCFWRPPAIRGRCFAGRFSGREIWRRFRGDGFRSGKNGYCKRHL